MGNMYEKRFKLLDQGRQNVTPSLLILFTIVLHFNVLAHEGGGGSNSLFGLIETWTQQWPTSNEIKLPGPLWHYVQEGTLIFIETGKLDYIMCNLSTILFIHFMRNLRGHLSHQDINISEKSTCILEKLCLVSFVVQI